MADSVEKIITPEFRSHFTWLIKPKPNKKDPNKPRFTTMMAFPAGTDMKTLRDNAEAATKAKWGTDAKDRVKHPKFKKPFKLGKELVDSKTGKMYNGLKEDDICVEAWTYDPLDLIGPRKEALTTDKEVYSGMYARAQVRAFAYAVDGSVGIAFWLHNLQKTRDGEKLGGAGNDRAADVFEPIDPPEGDAGSVFDDGEAGGDDDLGL